MRGDKRCFCCHLMPRIATPYCHAFFTPKPCPTLPEALGKVARRHRSHLFIVSVMLTHVRGYGYSCTRVWMLMYVSMDTHSCGQKIINAFVTCFFYEMFVKC